jgi:general stress protein CsbA
MAALLAGVVLFWFVLTRFMSGEINGIDFTVYYDRPTFQTAIGNPQYVESADDVLRQWRSYFAIHAHWVMLPLAGLYLLWASPFWLLALSVVAVVAGAVYTLRIVQHIARGR